VNISDEPGKVKWKYALPHKPIPSQKEVLPHFVWLPQWDEETGAPLQDKDGKRLIRKTGGVAATMADVIEAVKGQDIFMLHIVDSIEAGTGPFGAGRREYLRAMSLPVLTPWQWTLLTPWQWTLMP
jgi:hypothetical protein